jgi:DNA-binding PadR family transcriptional regulator
MAERTLTSYAVLGLLALHPLSAYELNQRYRRSVGLASPRGESAIYVEPKRLVADGLATASDEQRGRRTVAVYSITDAGREALRGWLSSPSSFPVIEAEAVVKAVFADQGDPADLRVTLVRLREAALARRAALAAIGLEYLDGDGPYPERVDLVALTGAFARDYFEFLARWSAWALDAVDSWPAERAERRGWARRVIRELADAVAADAPAAAPVEDPATAAG